MAVVIIVSLRVGQVTLPTSWRTCCTNWAGVVFAMSLSADPIGPAHRTFGPKWQEWRDSNPQPPVLETRSEEHTSELQSLMRISYAVFCLKKKKTKTSKH